MSRLAAVSALGLALACQTAEHPPLIPDSDGGGQPPLTGPSGCSFDVHAFAVPPLAGVSAVPFPTLGATVACAASSRAFDYRLVDMNGDMLPDLLVTSACDDPNVGVTTWRVYPNDGSNGFGSPLTYALPSIAPTPGCADTSLIDVDGDLAPDLVVTSLCTDTSVGTSRWLVYHNTGTSFDATATPFTLPTNATTGAFTTLESDSPDCTKGRPAFGFFDVTADRKPDLVVTTACDDVNVGVGYWRVYPGDGTTGVGAPTSFALPGGAVFASPRSASMSCSTTGLSTPSYTVVDFDGDFVPDLVVTQSCTDPGAGTTHWSVFRDDGTRFAQKASFASLPVLANAPTGAFTALAGTASCATGGASLTHAFVDVDGDYAPDLLLLASCTDVQVGVRTWLVFPNAGTGFGSAVSYTLPAELGVSGSAPATSLSGSLSCNGTQGTSAFQSAYLLGSPLDLVVTASCSDSSVGVSRWLAASATCPH